MPGSSPQGTRPGNTFYNKCVIREWSYIALQTDTGPQTHSNGREKSSSDSGEGSGGDGDGDPGGCHAQSGGLYNTQTHVILSATECMSVGI